MKKQFMRHLLPIRQYWLMGLVMLVAVSCKKESVAPLPVDDTELLVTLTGSDGAIQIKYGTDSLPVEITTSLLSDDDAPVKYTIRYRPDKKILDLNGNDGMVITPVYDAGIPLGTNYYKNNIHEAAVSYNLENGLYKLVTLYRRMDEGFFPALSFHFEHDATGNITQTVIMGEQGTPNYLVRQGHINFLYDQKKNPLYAHKDLLMLFLQAVSKNNITREDHFNKQLVLEDRYAYTYTYKSNDFPAKAKLKIGLDDATAIQDEIIYAYE
ncbi:MAG TPA: hypothetical protein PKC39_15785 [Ferruginibacter sp.]|nr:hypothetical protein [Ferruginibacter sp.]HMP22420.1 hypothetical protein [Ferruginibacter sp.]